MSKGICGYGRYNNDSGHVGCPRAKTSETPCIARDGRLALADDKCVGCGSRPSALLKELRLAGVVQYPDQPQPTAAAEKLRDVVREATEPLLKYLVTATPRKTLTQEVFAASADDAIELAIGNPNRWQNTTHSAEEEEDRWVYGAVRVEAPLLGK